MYCVGYYRRYQLYKLDNDDLEKVNDVGSHYERNSIIVFAPEVTHPTLKNELGTYSNVDDAAMAIDHDLEQNAHRFNDHIRAAAAISKRYNMERKAKRAAPQKDEQHEAEK